MALSDNELRGAQRQAEEATRTLKAAGLDAERLAVLAQTVSSASNAISHQALAEQVAASQKVANLAVPALGAITAAAWGADNLASRWAQRWPAMTAVAMRARAMHEALMPTWEQLQPLVEQLNHLAQIAADVHRDWVASLPPNLRGIRDLRISAVVDFMAEEGIPLYLVPRASTVEAFLRAEGRQSRRAILGSRSSSIVADCREVWARHRTPRTDEWIGLLDAGLQAYESGHTQAAQALFTVVLDTITFALPAHDRRRYTGRRNGSQEFDHLLDEQGFSTALAILPLWSIHEENWASQGHPVPRPLNRHASLHRASSKQYTKRNAIQALMLATSLLGWFGTYGPSESDLLHAQVTP